MSSAAGDGQRSLRSDFVVNLVGNIGYAAAQWVMLLVLVRLGSPAMVGEYSLGLAIGAPVVMFTNLRLAYLLASDASRARPFTSYFSLRLAANAVAFVTIMLWATLGGYRGSTWLVIVFVGIAKLAEALSDITFGYLSLRLRFRAMALSLALRGWGTVILMLVLRLLDVPLVGIAGALAAWWWLAFWVVDLRLVRNARIGDDPALAPPAGLLALIRSFRLDAALLELAWQAVPLGVVALSLSLAASIPRLTIARVLGADAVGYFSALAYVMVAGRMIAVALGTPTLPRLGRFVAAADRAAFLRTVATVVAFGLALGVAGVVASLLVGRLALTIVYGPDYAAWSEVLTLLLVASGLGYAATFLEDALLAMRRLVAQGVLLVATLGVIAVACATLVPVHGLRGAAWALVIGACVELSGAALLFWRAMSSWPMPEAVVPRVSAMPPSAG